MDFIEIKGQEIPLIFGMNFLRAANKTMTQQDDLGVKQNVGLSYLLSGVYDGDIEDLETVILLANGQDPTVTRNTLDAWIEDPQTDITEVFAQVIGFLSRANVSRLTWKRLVDQLGQPEILKTAKKSK